MFRLFSNVLIFLSIFLLPSYISILIIILGTLIFEKFLESMIYGFVLDILYGNGSIFGFHFAYFFTLVGIFFYFISFKTKTFIRFSA